jgi:hypothetical protein
VRVFVVCLLLPSVLQSALIAQLAAIAGCDSHRDAAGFPHLHAVSHSRHLHFHPHSHRHSHHHSVGGHRAGSGELSGCNCLQSPEEPEDAVYLTELTLQTRRPCEPAVAFAGQEVLCECSVVKCASAVCERFPAMNGPGTGGLTIFLLGCSLRL